MLKSTAPRKVSVPERLSDNYANVFVGSTVQDKGKLSQIRNADEFRSLWNALEKKPNTEVSAGFCRKTLVCV